MFKTKLAGHTIGIDNKYDYIEKYYQKYITDGEPEFTIAVNDEEIMSEIHDNRAWLPDYLETLAVYRKICEKLVDDDIVLFHCSALEIDGKAILFTAPSGTGKSTHASLWRKHFGDKVTMVNDDKPLLKISDQVTVYGTPYGGKDNIQNNTSAVVSAIVFLHQAKENKIEKMPKNEAFPVILNQTYRSGTIENMMKTLPLVDKLLELPVYSLGCTISEEAVELVYNTVF